MKYQAPYGVTDPNAGYVNGNPQIGVQGSIPPAASIEFPQREIVNLINSSKIIPADNDLFQLAEGTRSQAMNFADDTGAVNALVVALSPAITSYTRGLPLRVRVLHDNLVDVTHTSMTLDAGAGAAPIRKMDGSSPGNAEIRAGSIIEVVWDGTAWQLVNFGGAGGGGTINYVNVNIPYVVDTGTVNNIVAPFSPAITVTNAGFVCLVKVANSVTDVTTLKVNALPPKPVKAPDGSDLLPGDIVAGDVVEFNYDGTNFYVRPNPSIGANCTFNVPSTRWPTVASVMLAITRKAISPTAYVTIQLATNATPYLPFSIYHRDADQIIIKGTMLAAPPTYSNFFATGAASDSANNIAMLRTRYGTEIAVVQPRDVGNAGQGYAAGVTNLGPGAPQIQDILITGDNIYPGNNPYRTVGIFVKSTSIKVSNVATWGLTDGFNAIANGFIQCLTMCSASSCQISGWEANQGGSIRVERGCISIGSVNGTGMAASGGSVIYVVPPISGTGITVSNINYNALGVGSGQGSAMGIYGANILGNSTMDVEAAANGLLYVNGCNFNYSSPVLNTPGNINSYINYAAGYFPGPV
jgi:hypothetical protein